MKLTKKLTEKPETLRLSAATIQRIRSDKTGLKPRIMLLLNLNSEKALLNKLNANHQDLTRLTVLEELTRTFGTDIYSLLES